MGEWLGVAIAIVSSSLGGTAAAVTRYLVVSADPLTLALLRWGIGVLCVLPVALLVRARWPGRQDLPSVVGLGFLVAPVSALMAGLFSDDISALVEAKHYPQDPPGHGLSFGASLLGTLGFTATVIAGQLAGTWPVGCSQPSCALRHGALSDGRCS